MAGLICSSLSKHPQSSRINFPERWLSFGLSLLSLFVWVFSHELSLGVLPVKGSSQPWPQPLTVAFFMVSRAFKGAGIPELVNAH